jgi:hypothetical protein
MSGVDTRNHQPLPPGVATIKVQRETYRVVCSCGAGFQNDDDRLVWERFVDHLRDVRIEQLEALTRDRP